jgi:glycosyltransferase involved in cell wall biosynthesis
MKNMQEIKLSFIIPAYNEEKYLGKCLDSIFKEIDANPGLQTEVIVVNNASTDNTKTVALSYPKVKVVDENKKGLIIARQAGAAASRGQLLAHVDADCILPAGWIKKVLAEFDNKEKLVALSGPFICYDLPKFWKILTAVYYRIGMVIYFLNHYVFKIGALIQGGNFVVRRWAWEKMEKAGENFVFYGEDTILAKNLSKLGEVKFTLKFPILTSGRRLKEEGVLTTVARYVANYFSVSLFAKPVTKKYKDIRNLPE